MSCFHPLLAYVVGVNPLTGKDKLKIESYDELKRKRWIDNGNEVKEIPCGHCIGCRLDYSRQWANRMMLELKYHDSAYFITLTYADDFLPKRPVTDSNGEYVSDSYSLDKSHLSKFIKHLRKHFSEDKIRFFGVGEYGTNSFRPHYHVIVYGLHLDDLKVYKRTNQGDILYTSEKVNKCWSNYIGVDSHGIPRYDQIGWVVIAPVTWETCAYTARYVTKKMTGKGADFFSDYNLELPFSLMSRNPGIAYQWYKDNPGWEQFDFINVKTSEKGMKFRPPRYFEKLLEQDIPEVYQERKKLRQEFYKASRKALEASIEKPYLEYLADKEFLLKNRLNVLDRSEN